MVSAKRNAPAEAAAPVSISIVVSTYNRLPHLKRLLDALSHLDDEDFELVVVNGPSQDGTAEFLAAWPGSAKRLNCPVANLSRSRNLGLAQATGDIVVFIDDDALPASAAWLSNFRAFFADAANANCAAVGAGVVNAYSGEREFYRGSTSEYAEQSPQDGGQFHPASGGWTVPGVMGCNCAMRLAALRAIGGFDEHIAYYLDETDVCFRLYDAGYEVGFLDGNEVMHAGARSAIRTDAVRKNWRVIFCSDTYFCLKNSRDGVFRKLARILATARQKHFFSLLARRGSNRAIGRRQAVRGWCLSLLGIAEGLALGLFSQRRLSMPAPTLPERQRFRATRPARKLRIGLVSRTLPGGGAYGGPGQHTEALAHGLYALGHEVHLFSRPDVALPAGGLDFVMHSRSRSIEKPEFYDSAVPSTSLRLAAAVDFRRAVEAAAETSGPFDFIVGCNWDLETLAIIRAGICPVALYLVTPLAMNLELGTFPGNADNFLWNSLDRWQASHAALKCLPSSATLEVYQNLMGLSEADLQPLAVVPLGIEATHLPPLVLSGRRRLLFVGRLEKRKGIHILLRALPAILMEFPGWECHIVGGDHQPFDDGPPIKSRFLREHHRAAWRHRVIFHGYCRPSALHDHYRSCDLFVVPALYESFGLAYHEAMQYGKAVIGCRAGGMPETVADGVEGLLVEPGDVASLQAALRQLMRDDARRETMGRAGAERIRERDNHEAFARRMEAAILAELGRPAAEPAPLFAVQSEA